MLALDVLLDVTCCVCNKKLAVTLRCEGEGLLDPEAKALARLTCPYCEEVNHVIFEPETGEVIDVMKRLRIVRSPEPSLN